MPQISIITVGMNHLPYLKVLLNSLYEEYPPHVDFEMIYVDNCSIDGSVSYVKEHFPKVKVIVNSSLLGFGENNNKGVFASRGKYIAIINPDIIFQKNSLDILYQFMERYPEVGIVVPQLLNSDGSIQYSVREFISIDVLWARFTSKGKDDTVNTRVEKYLCRGMDFGKIQPVDWAIGASLFMSRDIFAELEGFDSDYFLYMEDEDICLRTWDMKRAIIYCPNSKMIHNHFRASSKLSKKTWQHIKSLIVFFFKHGLRIESRKGQYRILNNE